MLFKQSCFFIFSKFFGFFYFLFYCIFIFKTRREKYQKKDPLHVFIKILYVFFDLMNSLGFIESFHTVFRVLDLANQNFWNMVIFMMKNRVFIFKKYSVSYKILIAITKFWLTRVLLPHLRIYKTLCGILHSLSKLRRIL